MKRLVSVFLICISMVLIPVTIAAESIKPNTAVLLEPVLPGVVFFANNRPISGSLMLAGRLSTLGLAIHFQNQANDYMSAQKAAENADLYYGPGLMYKDPYSSGYKSSRQFRKEADRNLAFSNYMVFTHLILLGTAVYNGLLFVDQEKQRQAPVFEIDSALLIAPTGPQDRRNDNLPVKIRIPIRLDF